MSVVADEAMALNANTAPTRPAAHATVLAFDFGARFIGVAVGDTETGMASPLCLIEGESGAVRFGRIAALIAEWQPGSLLVGLPLAMDGAEHDLTRRARRFARQLQGRFGLPVALADERLSSRDAEQTLRGMGRGGRAHKHDSHALAAQIVLQAHLDELRHPDGRRNADGGANAAA